MALMLALVIWVTIRTMMDDDAGNDELTIVRRDGDHDGGKRNYNDSDE